MTKNSCLAALSVEELREELRAREYRAKPEPTLTTYGLRMQRRDDLSDIGTSEIIDALRSGQKSIYGTDNRTDIYDVTDQGVLEAANSVAAIFRSSDVTDNGDGTSTLRTIRLSISQGLCEGERYADQPVGAFCTAFLIEGAVIATAGHCVNSGTIAHIRFIFGFRLTAPNSAQITVDNGDIYSAARLLGRMLTKDGIDYAVVQLDRTVTGRTPLTIRKQGRIADNQSVYVLGHPSGLPLKYAPGAAVRTNSDPDFFVANLDTFGGNSGSPVLCEGSNLVEGILVRGDTDYVFDDQRGCNVALVCPVNGCRGEDCRRITRITYSKV